MEENKTKLPRVSSNPHIRDHITTNKIMLIVVIALLIPAGYGVYHFGLKALLIIALSVCGSVFFEWAFCKIAHKAPTIGDLSAVVTGILLALNLPVSVPWWIPVIGSFFAIVVVKMLYGGLGKNFMNPALGARCFLLISFPKLMTDFAYDAVSGPTPLAQLKSGNLTTNITDMIIGNTAGTIGETSMIAIVIGACIMIMLGVIDLYVSGTYIAAFAVFLLLFSGKGLDMAFLCAHLAGGGLMLGAFFMATDYVTRPVSKKGQIIYGIFLGFLTAIFRCFSPSAEGVSYAIIIGNLLVPIIEKFTVPVPFGVKKSNNKGGKK